MVKKDELVKDLDDLNFETKVDSNKINEFEDISEEELQEIEELVEKPKKKKIKKEKKSKSKSKTKPKKQKIQTKIKKDKPKKRKKKKGKSIFYIVLALVVIALVLAAGFMTNWFQPKSIGPAESEVAAYVNGEPILTDFLNKRYEQASLTSMIPLEKMDVLDTLIEQKLIEQEAIKNNISVSRADSEASLNELLVMRGMTKEQIIENLAQSGSTLDELLDDFGYYLLLEKLSNATFASNITISNQEVFDYLSQRFLVRHILLLSEEENETLYNQLVEIKEKLEKDDSTFCNYVINLSEDPASVPKCGQYFFAKGEMVPEFEEAAFNLKSGEMEIIKTAYGYHLIQKLKFDDETLKLVDTTIRNAKINQAYIKYLNDLKMNSDIEIVYNVSMDAEEEIVVEEESPFEIIGEEPEEVETEEIEVEEEMPEEEVEVVVEEIPEELEVETEEVEVVVEEIPVESEEEIIEEEVEVIEEEPSEIMYEVPTLKYFYSESDEKKAEITQLIKDLETQGYVDMDWKCIRVNSEDKELCIELYSEYHYETSMQEARELGLKYAPTLFINDVEYAGDYTIEQVKNAICELAGC